MIDAPPPNTSAAPPCWLAEPEAGFPHSPPLPAQSPQAVDFTVPGLPTPWARAGRKGGFSYTLSKQRSAMAGIKTFAAVAMRGRAPLQGPVMLRLDVRYPWPKTVTKKRRASDTGHYKDTKPDLSNLLKLVEDTLNGIVFRDDAQIASLVAYKSYADAAETAVTVLALGEST